MQLTLLLPLLLLFITQSITAAVLPSIKETNSLSPRSTDLILTPKDSPSLEKAFDIITSIPDSVLLAGDSALKSYLINTGIIPPGGLASTASINSADDEDGVVSALGGNPVTCFLKVSWVIITIALPAVKIFKIKGLVQKLGGAAKVVLLLLQAKTPAEREKLGGEGLVQLFEELLGVREVKEACGLT